MNEFETTWSTKPIHDADRIQLGVLSVGIKGLLTPKLTSKFPDSRVGSLHRAGGFLREGTKDDERFRIIAAHTVSRKRLMESPLAVPPRWKFTDRFEQLFR